MWSHENGTIVGESQQTGHATAFAGRTKGTNDRKADMGDDDSDKSLDVVLGYLVGRVLKQQEILEALQMSRSRYFELKRDGALITANNLVLAANNLGINEVDLLARFGIVTDEAEVQARGSSARDR